MTPFLAIQGLLMVVSLNFYQFVKVYKIFHVNFTNLWNSDKAISPRIFGCEDERNNSQILNKWLKNQLQSCDAVIFAVLKKFNLRAERRTSAISLVVAGDKNNVTFDGIEATFNAMESLLYLAIKLGANLLASFLNHCKL